MAAHFDEETLLIKGDNFRHIINRVSHFVINNYISFYKCDLKWNFHDAFFFAGTIATTIGYGRNVPQTKNGKLFCLGFVLLGIPYCAYLINAISERESKKFLKKYINI